MWVGEKSIYAHKLVLGCRGYWGVQLGDVSRLDMNDVSFDVARAMLRWLYTEHIDDSTSDVDMLIQFLRASTTYALKELTERFVEGPSPWNFAHLLSQSDRVQRGVVGWSPSLC